MHNKNYLMTRKRGAPFDYGVRAAQLLAKYKKKEKPEFNPNIRLDTSQVEDLRRKQ